MAAHKRRKLLTTSSASVNNTLPASTLEINDAASYLNEDYVCATDETHSAHTLTTTAATATTTAHYYNFYTSNDVNINVVSNYLTLDEVGYYAASDYEVYNHYNTYNTNDGGRLHRTSHGFTITATQTSLDDDCIFPSFSDALSSSVSSTSSAPMSPFPSLDYANDEAGNYRGFSLSDEATPIRTHREQEETIVSSEEEESEEEEEEEPTTMELEQKKLEIMKEKEKIKQELLRLQPDRKSKQKQKQRQQEHLLQETRKSARTTARKLAVTAILEKEPSRKNDPLTKVRDDDREYEEDEEEEEEEDKGLSRRKYGPSSTHRKSKGNSTRQELELKGKWIKCSHKIIKRERRPLTIRDIINIAINEGIISTKSKTPKNTLTSILNNEVRKTSSLFLKVGPCLFTLKQF